MNGTVATKYPEVVLAAARTDGFDLRLVAYPGREAGPVTLRLANLRRGRRYASAVNGTRQAGFHADAAGYATVGVDLDGRTAVDITAAD